MTTTPPISRSNPVLAAWHMWLSPRTTDRDERFRERTIRGVVVLMAIIALIQLIIFTLPNTEQSLGLPLALLVISALTALAVGQSRLKLAGWLMTALGFVYMVITMFQVGYWVPGVFAAAIVTISLGAILLPSNNSKIIPFLLIFAYAVLSLWLDGQGIKSPYPRNNLYGNPLTSAVLFTIVLVAVSGAQSYLLTEFRAQRRELKDLVETLEERVAVRTRDLSVAAQVSQQVTQVLDLKRLLPELTELTRRSFDLYHVSIFLYYEETQMLRLQAGTGEAGSKMVASGKQFHLDARGLVPLSVRQRQPQVINDVQQSQDYLPNPYLPITRSEIALPMLVGGKIMGVLDLQSEQVGKFGPDDVKVLATLTEQIAIAVRNADLFALADQSRQEAEKANSVKSQFLAAMSHELRTPLNAILNFTQFVSSGMLGPINGEQAEMLEKVVQSGKHLLSLINDVLDISKIEAGALKLFIENNLDLAADCKSMAETARSLLGVKPVTLQVAIAENLPKISGDQRRIRQVMLNLVSNACKFTDQGSIRINLEQRQDYLVFSVHDTGPGIPSEDAETIFEVFRQNSTGLRQGEGTGLGLPISRRLAEAHGGSLWYESLPGHGSSFFFSLPIQSGEVTLQEVSQVA